MFRGKGDNLCNLRLGKEFLDVAIKVQLIKQNIDKLNVILIKNFCYVKDPVK